jgi:hypothetical protein
MRIIILHVRLARDVLFQIILISINERASGILTKLYGATIQTLLWLNLLISNDILEFKIRVPYNILFYNASEKKQPIFRHSVHRVCVSGL